MHACAQAKDSNPDQPRHWRCARSSYACQSSFRSNCRYAPHGPEWAAVWTHSRKSAWLRLRLGQPRVEAGRLWPILIGVAQRLGPMRSTLSRNQIPPKFVEFGREGMKSVTPRPILAEFGRIGPTLFDSGRAWPKCGETWAELDWDGPDSSHTHPSPTWSKVLKSSTKCGPIDVA